METIHFAQWLIVLVASAAAAWGGTRYALASHGKKLDHHQGLLEGLRLDMSKMTPSTTTEKMQEEIKKMIPFSVCRDRQADCSKDNEASTAEILKKIDKLSETIARQDQKRETGKDAFQAAITEMAKQVSGLEATIRERRNMFRKDGSDGEPHSWV